MYNAKVQCVLCGCVNRYVQMGRIEWREEKKISKQHPFRTRLRTLDGQHVLFRLESASRFHDWE